MRPYPTAQIKTIPFYIVNHDMAISILPFYLILLPNMRKCTLKTARLANTYHSLGARIFSRRSHRPEIIVEIPMAHHNVSYRWSDRELRSFEVQEWIYDGAWKLAADLAPSDGIHSCTSKPHNLRMETSGRYEITQWFYSMSYRNFCISVNGRLYVHIEQIPSNLTFLISLGIIFKLYFSESW